MDQPAPLSPTFNYTTTTTICTTTSLLLLSRIHLMILAHLHRQHDFTLSESNPTPVYLLPSKHQCPHLPHYAITA